MRDNKILASFRFNVETLQKLKSIAKDKGCSSTEILEQLINSSTPVNTSEPVDIIEPTKGNNNVNTTTNQITSTTKKEKVVVNEKEIETCPFEIGSTDWAIWIYDRKSPSK